jgi:hypothetical protein
MNARVSAAVSRTYRQVPRRTTTRISSMHSFDSLTHLHDSVDGLAAELAAAAVAVAAALDDTVRLWNRRRKSARTTMSITFETEQDEPPHSLAIRRIAHAWLRVLLTASAIRSPSMNMMPPLASATFASTFAGVCPT